MESSKNGSLNHCSFCLLPPYPQIFTKLLAKGDRLLFTINCKKPCGFVLPNLKLLYKKTVLLKPCKAHLISCKTPTDQLQQLVKSPEWLSYTALQRNL